MDEQNYMKPRTSIDGITMPTTDKILYDCYAISNHSGTLNGGHYTAYCRHPFDRGNINDPLMNDEQYEQDSRNREETWHLYNDRAVSQSNSDNVISGDAYLLFFEKK